jgi:hypothetical protein
MNTFYFTLTEQTERGYFAKVSEANIRGAIIAAVYPYKRDGKELFLGLTVTQKDGVDLQFASASIQANGTIIIKDTDGHNVVYTEYEAERAFLHYCQGVEYYNEAKELALKYGMIEYNHETEEQKSKYTDSKNWSDKQQEIMKHTAEEIEREIGLVFADKKEASNYFAGMDKETQKILNTECPDETPKLNDLSFNVMSDICDEIISTLKKKNDDYGNSYIKNIERFGKQAMLIPMFNKLDRLESLSKKENQNFETFEDSLRDLMGYCLMATQHLIKTRGK